MNKLVMNKILKNYKAWIFLACVVLIFWYTIYLNGVFFGILMGICLCVLFSLLWMLAHLILGFVRTGKSIKASQGDETMMKLEKLRQESQKKQAIILTVIIVVAIILFRVNPLYSILFLIAAFLVFSARGFFKLFSNKKGTQVNYSTEFKQTLVVEELSRNFSNISFDPNYAFQLGEIKKLDLFADPSRAEGNDMIDADYRDIHFAQSDIRISEQSRSVDAAGNVRIHGSGDYSEIFRGRMIRMDFEKPFKGTVQIFSEDFKNAKRSGGVITGHAEKRAGWSRVDTELESFNRTFNVFAPNAQDAFETLTPQMIEGMDRLRQTLKKSMAFCFVGHSMYVLITGIDAFDVSLKATVQEEKARLQQDVQTMVDFMETMYFRKQ